MKLQKLITICITITLCLSGFASAKIIDIVAEGSHDWASDGAYFEQIGPQPTGTGVFEPFVRIGPDSGGLEAGYNTDGAVEFQTKSSIHTHSIMLGDIPVVEGKLEFILDIDESEGGDESLLSLDVMKIYLADAPDITGYATNIEPTGGVYNVVKIYDLPGSDWVKMLNRDSGPGNGTGDMRCLIPVNNLEQLLQTSANKWLYLYSEFGGNGDSGCTASDGFEEWGVAPIPEPATVVMLALGTLGFIRRKQTR